MKKPRKPGKSHLSSPESSSKQQYPPDWVPIQEPPNLEEMLLNWAESDDRGIGLCLLCGQVIGSEAELIPGTPLHNCSKGHALEANNEEG